MRIEWKITKKRGNMRPVLVYSAALEDHEKELALPGVSITSSIPKPEEDSQDYCYPGQFERASKASIRPQNYHVLEIPSHKGHSWTHTLRLPWRKDNNYPEIEESFHMLREAFEKELTAAYDSTVMNWEQHVECSARAKTAIAPGILAERFLRLADKSFPNMKSPTQPCLPRPS